MNRIHIRGHELTERSPGIWRIEPSGKRRVGVHLVGSQELLTRIGDDASIEQALNVACLPGVQDPVLTMPDIHQGYGFPIGGVAAFHPKTGVVSPGGVGYDINCGVRLLRSNLDLEDLTDKNLLKSLVQDLFENIPSGVGSHRKDLCISDTELDEVLHHGAHWAVKRGFGTKADLEHIEEQGRLSSADPDKVSKRAKERGLNQIGTLGSGNHFLEIQYIDPVYDPKAADQLGLRPNQIVVTIHTGSRGLGYQVCSDYLDITLVAARRYKIDLPDRELAAAPIQSKEGQDYLGAMAAAANFAFANRQVITHWVREVFERYFPQCQFDLVYDVCHNIAKFEDFKKGSYCIHRKGATRAYPGQPVLVPGDMGRYSYVLMGTADALDLTFGSACHGAGREMSRAKAKKVGKGRPVVRELEDKGIIVRSSGRETLLEEMPEAYKDVADVVEATEHAGIATKVARLNPMGVVKG